MKPLIGVTLSVVVAMVSVESRTQAAGKFADSYSSGQAHATAGRHAQARAEYEKALTVKGITPDQRGRALVGIGAAYIREKEIQNGIAAVRKARALKGISNQTRIQANLLFGQTYLAYPWVLDQARDALIESLNIPGITPEQKIAAQKGLVQAQMGLRQFAKARAMMKALAANPALAPAEKLPAQMAIGKTYFLEGKHPEARAELTKILDAQGVFKLDKVDIQLYIALSYYESRDYRHAKGELEKVLTMPNANTRQFRGETWGSYIPSRQAKLRLMKMNSTDKKEKPIAALFVGSSMTSNGYMPLILERLASSAPPEQPRMMNFMHTRGGTKIDVFWNQGDTRDTARGVLVAVPWDVVVLEMFYTMKPEDLLKYGKLFADFARSKNVKPLIYESQPAISLSYPEGALKFHKDILTVGRKLNIPVAPVVLAQMFYLEAVPTAKREEFYAGSVHPTDKGRYLAAYCVYSAMTGYSPVGLSHPESISAEDAKALQEAAWKAVQKCNPGLKPYKTVTPAPAGDRSVK